MRTGTSNGVKRNNSFWISICGLCYLVTGCVSQTSVPRIVYTPEPRESVSSLSDKIVPMGPTAADKPVHRSGSVPGSWFPPPALEKQWQAIVIHHSGTANGNMAIFDQWHRERRQWEGVGYDFVIGNGTDSGDGQVEVTFRWTGQKVGAHCKTPRNWANEHAVGICLVGDFDQTYPTRQQMRSLVRLITFLQQRYTISPDRIYGHNTTPGAGVTNCPGAHFPINDIHEALARLP